MLTKDECEWAMVNLNDPDFVNEEDISVFAKLIEEHFNPKPLEFEDLKEGLFVWDRAFKKIIQITSVDKENNWIGATSFGGDSIKTMFQKNRFLFINIPSEY